MVLDRREPVSGNSQTRQVGLNPAHPPLRRSRLY
jgi:hypothetical protein